MPAGLFITFEGVDGSGKTTQLELLAAALPRPVLVTREPGGTPLGEAVRGWVLGRDGDPPAPRAELALLFAARAQHVERVIAPALARGEIVLCDRFTDATEAYQGAARGLGIELVRELDRLLCGGCRPDLTLILDLEPAAALARAQQRLRRQRSAEGRFEAEGAAFAARVAAAYRAIARREPERCVLIAADGTIEEVRQRVWAAVAARLHLPAAPLPSAPPTPAP
ncbi:MAG: dTMP kinase [Terriglobales bacterium]